MAPHALHRARFRALPHFFAVLGVLHALGVMAWMRGRMIAAPRFPVWHAGASVPQEASPPIASPVARAHSGESAVADPEPVERASPWNAPTCQRPVHVRAILAGRDVQWSFAALAPSAEAPALLVRAGDRWLSDQVWYVGTDRIWLVGPNGLCQVRMYDGASSVPSPERGEGRQGAQREPLRGASTGIQRVDSHDFDVDRAVLQEVLDDPGRALAGVQVTPARTAKGVAGFRLAGVRPRSLLAALGLKNGDILLQVDGVSLSNPTVIVEVLARLPRAERAAVTVQRGGQGFTLQVNIR